MRRLTCLGIFAAAVTFVAFSEATFAVDTADANPGSTGATRVALDGNLRNCDFTKIATAAQVPNPGLGHGMALVHTAGSTVAADVTVAIPNQPGMHYDVGLIQVPRSSAATCGPGDPGTAFTGLDTDAAGNGTVTVQDTVRQGTTGVWVMVARANPHSQSPAEYYTSEFLVPV